MFALVLVASTGACGLGSPRGGDAADGAGDPGTGTGSYRAHAEAAQQAVLDAFDDYEVVAGFGASHGDKEVDDFLLALVRDPELPDQVDDIAIECGNARYQDVLDRYVAGDDVPATEVQKVWRNTTQPHCGFSTFYEQLIPLVRRVNEDLPDDEQLRVLACDPPVDWDELTGPEDFEQQADRTASIVGVMEREVLEKGRNALMFYGINHVRHLPGTAVGTYEADGYDGVTYVVDDHHGFGNNDPALGADNDDLEARMVDWPVPSIARVEGSWLADLDTGYFNQPPGDAAPDPTGPPGVDAYLYLGPRDTLLSEPGSAQALLDEDYLAELGRRAELIDVPPDGVMRPENMLRLVAESGVFLFDPR